jgi:hypothetical protein
MDATCELKFDVDEKVRAVFWPSGAGDINAIKLGRRWGFVLWRRLAARGDSRGCENIIFGGVRVVR